MADLGSYKGVGRLFRVGTDWCTLVACQCLTSSTLYIHVPLQKIPILFILNLPIPIWHVIWHVLIIILSYNNGSQDVQHAGP